MRPAADPDPVTAPPSLPALASLSDELLRSLRASLDDELVRRAVAAAVAELEHRRETPEYLTADEAASRIGRSRSWLDHHWREELAFGFRDGGRLLFPAAEVAKYLRRLPRGRRG